MHVNTAWLLDYLEPACSHTDLLNAFTAAGLEVEEEHDLAEELRSVVVGFVREKRPIAEVPGLFHTQIEIASGRTIDVVCASEHEVQVGWGVPVATAGTHIPTRKEPLKAGNFHGVASEGMICLDGELGLVARGSGLQVFDDESLLGKPLPEVCEISEWLVELAILPNRPDCLGMLGIAREMAAVLGLTLKYPTAEDRLLKCSPKSVVPVTIEDAELCPRYLCQVIRGVKVGPSPQWLKSRLLLAGKRPINNVVDVTNFVLLEWGQPLHAFDLAEIRGGEIQVRTMKPGESLKLLDETLVDGKTGPLVIADAERPVALAGIMGGDATQTTAGTTDVLLEAACFGAVGVRATSRKLGVRSDSSYRFERGTDPNRMLLGAATRAAELIVELAGGTLDGECTEQYPAPREPLEYALTEEQFSGLLGMPVDAGMIRDNLTKLGMDCTTELRVKVPTWRMDCTDAVALIEDVARLVGYDAVPLQPTASSLSSGKTLPLDRLRRQVADSLSSLGFLECRTPPLVAADETGLFASDGGAIRLQNPMRSDMAEVRRSLLPSLLEVVERNARRGAETFRFYEIDRTFELSTDPSLDPRPSTLDPLETWSLGIVIGGPTAEYNWQRESAAAGFFHLKGLLENLFEEAGAVGCEFSPTQRPGFVPGTAAIAASEGRELAVLGQVDPALLAKSKLRIPVFAAEVHLPNLLAHYEEIRRHAGLPRTQAVDRDLAVILPHDVTYGAVEKTVRESFADGAERVHAAFLKTANGEARREAKSPVLEQVRCVDLYRGKPIPADRKSLAIRLTFRDAGRTLTSEESNELTQSVVDALTKQHNAELRG